MPISDLPSNITHTRLLRDNLRQLTGRELCESSLDDEQAAHVIFHAPYALVSHNTSSDPVFNYGNQTALNLFCMTWEEFTALPSRLSAEAPNREERARLLAEVTAKGFIDNYSGIRISKTGQRFRIERALVWNLHDTSGNYHGQAAMFDHWHML